MHKGVRYHPLCSRYLFYGIIRVVEAAKQGVNVGEDMVVSGLMFAHDFVGIAETPDGLQKQIEKALEYTRNWRVAANVNKSVILVCDEDNKNPV